MPWHQQAMKDAIPAISFGEPEKGVEPEISEWGNPIRLTSYHCFTEYIGKQGETR